ncbi:chemotaxis protein CheW [bacterium]|nr:chemotaxis protein CheW [bacterium]
MSELKVKPLFKESHGKLLTFLVCGQEYGIPILQAREVVATLEINVVPNTPDFVLGVINLRGKIVPVLDLRHKFDLQPIAADKESCIVIVDMNQSMTGLLIDHLLGVITIEEEDYAEAPKLGSEINTQFMQGIIKLDSRIIIVLDIEHILENQEINELENVGELA